MRYIDSGKREVEQTLGFWLKQVLTETISEVRWQSGYFNRKPLGFFAPTLEQLSRSEGPVRVLVGSNAPGGVLRDDVLQLLTLIRLPRPNANLGIVRYRNAFYHPKTYHFRRLDGSQCAYVGSSNLTERGTSIHVEAGIILDSREGDPTAVLDAIAAAVDVWFDEHREGLYEINSTIDVDLLVEQGLISLTPPPPPPTPPDPPGQALTAGSEESRLGFNDASTGPPLTQLITVPVMPAVAEPPLSVPSTTLASPSPPKVITPIVPTAVPVFHHEVESGRLDPRHFTEFWVQAGSMSTGGSHNILELPRYANHFFGFSFDNYQLEEHVVIDRPVLTCGTHRWDDRQLAWHGGQKMNKMERITMPTVNQGGFDYAYTAVHFRRHANGFEIQVAPWSSAEADAWREASRSAGRVYRLGVGGGRICGLLGEQVAET